jgi:acyl carrier protein
MRSCGGPIDNTQIYILDDNLHPVPTGVPGELYIGGHGVGRGYLNRPSLTAERFVRNPFGSDGDRMYRTGDLARYQPDGTIQFLGRADHQVKIHGFRIEPGEIETQLQNHAEVASATVLAREDGAHKRLVAYIVRRAESTLTPATLRSYARGFLPEYMVPNAFVFVDELPLTPNGKLDRSALPIPGDADVIRSEIVEPSTDTERTLTRVCAEVLHLDRVSVLDNLFDLGGDSVSFLTIAMRVQEALGFEMPVRWVFETPVISNLAAQIDAAPAIVPVPAPVPDHAGREASVAN